MLQLPASPHVPAPGPVQASPVRLQPPPISGQGCAEHPALETLQWPPVGPHAVLSKQPVPVSTVQGPACVGQSPIAPLHATEVWTLQKPELGHCPAPVHNAPEALQWPSVLGQLPAHTAPDRLQLPLDPQSPLTEHAACVPPLQVPEM